MPFAVPEIFVFLIYKLNSFFFYFYPVTASAIFENNEIVTILCHFIRTHGPKLWLRNIDDRAANLYETSASIFHQRSESNRVHFKMALRNYPISNLLTLFACPFCPHFSCAISEWYAVSSSILGYVAVFNVHFRCRRLDDLFGSFFTHRYT